MRSLLRLLLAVALGVVALVAAAIAVPVAVRGIARHGATAVAEPLAPLSEAISTGSTVYAADGSVLADLHSSIMREPVRLSAVPQVLRTAVLDTEDHGFYSHGGVDVHAEIRALVNDSGGGSGLQGGSDITQQLVKNVYLTDERTVTRKIKEAFLADRLQKLYTKDQILDAYLNTIYLGSGAYGVQAAAETYWQKPVGALTLPQAALLAGLIQDPSGYDPVTDPVAARVRRSQVLGRMLYYRDITKAQYASADAAPLPTSASTASTSSPSGVDGYYVQEVEDELLGANSPLGPSTCAGSDNSACASIRYDEVFNGGLKIYTNLVPSLQSDAEAAVTADTPANSAGYQEALVSINPASGAVEAMIAGQDYSPSNSFDVVTQGRRQPGSGFKLFTLLAALEDGDNIYDPVDGTSPCAIPFPGNDSLLANPAHNDEGDGQSGMTTIQEATAQSLNCAYLRMAHQVGLPAVVSTAEALGIPAKELDPVATDPSMVIGAAAVSPLQMSDAYATLANGGTYRPPSFIAKVVDRSGTVVYTQPTAGKQVIPSDVIGEADSAFQAVVTSGTGTAAAVYGRPVAGKTGTNNGPTDAWFNGFTPQIETTVWMGYPPKDGPKLPPAGGLEIIDGAEVYGGTYPARTVGTFLASALASDPVEQFPAVDYSALPPTSPVPEVTGSLPGSAYGYGSSGYGSSGSGGYSSYSGGYGSGSGGYSGNSGSGSGYSGPGASTATTTGTATATTTGAVTPTSTGPVSGSPTPSTGGGSSPVTTGGQ